MTKRPITNRPESEALARRGAGSIAGGVVSLNRRTDPPISFVRARGSRLWDVDGNEYVDYHAAFAPHVLEAIGCEVVPLHCRLDHSFPHHNPNPEDMSMLDGIRHVVRDSGADVGFGFDGDGDRCGVIDDRGDAIFADRVGVMLARDISARVSPPPPGDDPRLAVRRQRESTVRELLARRATGAGSP